MYVSNISEEGVLIQGNNLWVPKEGTAGDGHASIENLAREFGVEIGGWSFGAQFGDLNNDGTLDLVSDERLHVARSEPKLLVRLFEGRGREQHDH